MRAISELDLAAVIPLLAAKIRELTLELHAHPVGEGAAARGRIDERMQAQEMLEQYRQILDSLRSEYEDGLEEGVRLPAFDDLVRPFRAKPAIPRKGRRDPPSDAMALAEDLRRAVGTFVRVIREEAATERSAQSETLGLLDREGAMNVAALAQRRSVTHQSMRVVVAQLVANGWVERSADPSDRRSWLVSLSRAGRAKVRRDRRARTARIGRRIDTVLSVAERKQLQAAVGLLDRISSTGMD